MAKLMLFVDGTWLYCNVPRLSSVYGKENFRVDFGKLPRVLALEVNQQAGGGVYDIVRTHLFGSYATNFDLRDEDAVQRRRDFFDMLREEYHYEVEAFPINFRGRRLRSADRDPQDGFEPKEKCVDISLAAAMLYYAAIPGAYDIAVAVLGDRDFKPVLQAVRRLGKRVAIASIKGSCAPEFADSRDAARLRDFDVVWLDDLLDELELRYERHQLECQSPMHQGNRLVWTTFHPRKGQKFYCSECLAQFASQKRKLQDEYVTSRSESTQEEAATASGAMNGTIAHIVSDRGFGFVRATNGQDYFFHLTDLRGSLEFEDLFEGLEVDFELKREPANGRAGAAQNVRPRGGPTEDGPMEEYQGEEDYDPALAEGDEDDDSEE